MKHYFKKYMKSLFQLAGCCLAVQPVRFQAAAIDALMNVLHVHEVLMLSHAAEQA